MMTRRSLAPALFALCATLGLQAAASAQEIRAAGPEVQTSITLGTGPADTSTVHYDCGQAGTRDVTYVNAPPNALALLAVEDGTRLFTTTISASGARYISGPFEWWSKGGEATLRNLTAGAESVPLMTCKAIPATDATAK